MTAQSLDAPRGFFPKAERDKLLARIDDLEAEVEELRARLLGIGGTTAERILEVLPLWRSEALLLGALYDAFPHSLTHAALYEIGQRFEEGDALDPQRLVVVRVCTTRRKLAQYAAPETIKTVWGVGYVLTPQGRQWLAGLLEAIPQPAAPEHAPTASQSPAKGNLKQGGAS